MFVQLDSWHFLNVDPSHAHVMTLQRQSAKVGAVALKQAHAISAFFWIIATVCFIAPLLWLAWVIAVNPFSIVEASVDWFRLNLLVRTILYNAMVAVIATLIAIPAAIALGRPRRWISAALMVLLPISLLLPSITFEYGWKQALRLAGAFPSPQSAGDVARCVWTLAAWLWPIPAALGAIALRRVDSSLLEQALLDGVLSRMTLRIAAKPLAIGGAIVFVIASQEFAVFEPSGISVVATEVRMVFETGAFSSADNPITQTFGAGASMEGSRDQSARAAAAVATGLPMMVSTIVVAAVLWILARRWTIESDLHTGPRPAVIRSARVINLAAYAVLAIAVGVPIVALFSSLDRRPDPLRIWREFAPQISGSIALASLTSFVAIAIVLDSLRRRRRWIVIIAALCFLIGGQMLAIGLIRIFNRDATAWVYDSFVITIVAYAARFGWIALAAALATWQRPWVNFRDMSAVDGANEMQTLWRIVLPLAWPIVASAALLVAVLSLTEVPATMLLSPQNPQPIVPLLMTWVHLQRYDAMIEGTLLLSAVVMFAAVGVVVLSWMAWKVGAFFRPR